MEGHRRGRGVLETNCKGTKLRLGRKNESFPPIGWPACFLRWEIREKSRLNYPIDDGDRGSLSTWRRARRRKGVGWSRGRKGGRVGGWLAGWLAWHRGWKVKREKIKYIPGHWRDFVSYILFEPIGFIYAAGCRIRGGLRGRLKCRAAGKAVLLLFHPHHALSVSGTGRFYCIFNSTLFIHVPFQRSVAHQLPARYFNGVNVTRGWKWWNLGREVYCNDPNSNYFDCFRCGSWRKRLGRFFKIVILKLEIYDLVRWWKCGGKIIGDSL